MNKILYQDRYFAVQQNEQGDGFLSSGDEVLVVPIDDDGRAILQVEPSPAFGEATLILCGGEVEQGEVHAVTAQRELQEEIGKRAGRLDYLVELRPWSKYLRVRAFVYLARQLESSVLAGDEQYEIATRAVGLKEVAMLVQRGEIRDARVIAALALAQHALTHTG